MAKGKFILGTVLGTGLSYWAFKQWQEHQSEITDYVVEHLSQLAQFDFGQVKQILHHQDTQALQQVTSVKDDTTKNFDDIKLDESQIVKTED